MSLTGRRRPDTFLGDLPDDIQRGDYWKVLSHDGTPLRSEYPSNLTGETWMVAAPTEPTVSGEAFGVGLLAAHTVREHEDGTISVSPGDGSSNSILITGPNAGSYHGYIDHGVWS